MSEAVRDDILKVLDEVGEIADSREYCASRGLGHDDAFVGEMKRLISREMVSSEMRAVKVVRLTATGEAVLAEGSPEFRVFNSVPAEGIPLKDLKAAVGDELFKVGNGQCMKRGWLVNDKKAGLIKRKVESVVDETRAALQAIAGGSEEGVAELKKRKMVTEQNLKVYSLTKGPKFARQLTEYATELTVEHLKSGEWKTQEFKPYNFQAQGLDIPIGRLHPLLKMRDAYKQIFIEMGYRLRGVTVAARRAVVFLRSKNNRQTLC